MEDQICSSEKYSIKNSYNNNIFYLNEKNICDQNIAYWIQIYFDWMKIYFDITEKNGDIFENIFYWIQISFDWMKIYFGIMKKRWYNENMLYWLQNYFDWMEIYFHIVWIFIFATFQQPYLRRHSSILQSQRCLCSLQPACLCSLKQVKLGKTLTFNIDSLI